MKFICCMVASILLSFVGSSYSGEVGEWTTVKYIYTPANSGKPFIQFGANSMPGCYSNYGAYLPVAVEAGANRAYSTLLTAFMAQKEVRIYYDLSDVAAGYNGWGLCEITHVYLR